METENTIEQKDDEISLIDLLAVLIRHRKLIIITTLLAFVLSAVIFFALPKLNEKIFKKDSERKVLVIYNVRVEKMAPELTHFLNINLGDIVEKELKDYVNFSNVQREYNIFTEDNLTNREYNTVIKDLLDKKKFNIDVNYGGQVITISSEVLENRIEDYKNFISAYVNYCSTIIDGVISESIDSAKYNLDELIERAEKNENQGSDLSSLLSIRLAIKNYNDTHKQIVSLDGEPFEVNIALGRLKKVIIFTFAGFFVSIFAAFVINAVSNIKKDPEASKIISDAWKNGK
ncbi:MAG: hypothetical protein HUK25_08075 [Treponema sp.]|nr:hypothetical protein [Treponema sp.]